MSERKYRVGRVRPSQVLWTYGPGAIIDLPNMSVITMGLEFWDRAHTRSIVEKRLLRNIQRILGPQVQDLCTPPILEKEPINQFSAEAYVGLAVRPFPRWLRCSRCGLLAEYDSGLFDVKENPYHPEQTRVFHVNCPKSKGKNGSDAVPARFLVACKNGHLDDFPWRWFVHNGKSDCRQALHFYVDKASLQIENVWVKCGCGAARSMVHAFGLEGMENLPGCRGRHAHLDSFEKCEERLRTIVLGSSSSWFPVTASVLALPITTNDPVEIINDRREDFENCDSVEEIALMLKILEKKGEAAELKGITAQEIFDILHNKTYAKSEAAIITDADVKPPEWETLTSPDPPGDFPHFLAKPTEEVPRKFADKITRVVLVERLRKVNALIGFTRIESLNEFVEEEEEDRPLRAPLSRKKPTWVPACEVFGEGVFIQFNEDALAKWEKRADVQKRDALLSKGQRGWNNNRGIEGDSGYPGIRYVMLHTLAHLIVREFALECGYNAASIQERVYATNADADVPMAGVLLYTAATDSDGTLGGLVELGKPEALERIITLALKRARICSADPLCAEHDPTEDNSLHGAACHSCAYISETSCEIGNRYLDRALVVPTFDCEDAAFFEE